ncbi:RNAseH domain-containing protein [Nostoc sp. CHAB 5844]|nr:RNAseH domain-containing protein [Nostoc sp. CHAB 5844]
MTCFYVLRRTKKTTANNKATTGALMVRVNPVTEIVQVTTPALFPTWVSYPVALEYLLSEKWDTESYISADIDDEEKSSDRQLEQQFYNDFITKCLRDCLSSAIEEEKNPRVLFMAEAQNARRILTWLRNPDLPTNDLPNEIKRNMTESEISRLWFVRLRVAENPEVPVAIVKGFPGSSSSSIFCWQNVCDSEKTAIYLSIRKPLTTEQGKNTLQQQQSRLDNGSLQAGSRKLLEIAVVIPHV